MKRLGTNRAARCDARVVTHSSAPFGSSSATTVAAAAAPSTPAAARALRSLPLGLTHPSLAALLDALLCRADFSADFARIGTWPDDDKAEPNNKEEAHRRVAPHDRRATGSLKVRVTAAWENIWYNSPPEEELRASL